MDIGSIVTAMKPLLIPAAAFGRSFAGWLKSSLRDGIIQDFEIKQLGECMVRVILIGAVVAYFPGVDISWAETAAVALGGDVILSAVKKAKIALPR